MIIILAIMGYSNREGNVCNVLLKLLISSVLFGIKNPNHSNNQRF